LAKNGLLQQFSSFLLLQGSYFPLFYSFLIYFFSFYSFCTPFSLEKYEKYNQFPWFYLFSRSEIPGKRIEQEFSKKE